ncbi:MAG: hypothetical protein NTY70_16520 [Burkholderiales bacterium]|nr:hypothetical protein [Burkholderiales bacterium]
MQAQLVNTAVDIQAPKSSSKKISARIAGTAIAGLFLVGLILYFCVLNASWLFGMLRASLVLCVLILALPCVGIVLRHLLPKK